MSFLRDLLGPPNPTRNWARDSSRSLELNLDSASLSGVTLGSPFASLEFLGQAKRSKSDPELWEFSPLGVAVEVQNNRIVAFFVVPIPDEHFAVEPYAGSVTVGGGRVSMDRISREKDVTTVFGEPTRRDADDEEIVFFYDMGQAERQIELTPQGRIKTIAIFSYP